MPPEKQEGPQHERRRGSDCAVRTVTKLLRVADALTRSLERTFAPFGIGVTEYHVLRILRGAAEPLPTMVVAERMLRRTPGVTSTLDQLQRQGLLRRTRSDDDRRVWLCSITREGLDLLQELEANWNALPGASQSELEQLARLLARIERPHVEERSGDGFSPDIS